MDRSTRLLLAIPHLGGGGAERVISLLAQHLDPALFEIHLVLLAPDGPGSPTLPPHIILHRLHTRRVRHTALPLLRLIRSLKPRLILSGMAHLSFLILLLKPFLPRRTRILIRQNTTASAAADDWFTSLAYRRLYPRAHRILCQSQAMADDLAQHFALAPEKLTVLHNPITPPTSTSAASPQSSGASSHKPHLLFVGRLSHEKGADLLLHAFAELRRTHPTATLTLLGVGPEELSLRDLANSLGITPHVKFEGHADPTPFFRAATLFVLPSRHEGIPNALLEAAAAGLPIVATPASQGLVDLLRDSPGCWLTPRITAAALAQTLLLAIDELPTLPAHLPHAFLAPFRLSTAIEAYSELLLAQARPTLAFLIPTLDHIGGAERQVLNLAQELASRRWSVTLITLSGSGQAISYQAPSQTLPQQVIPHLSLQMRKAWIDPRGWLIYLRWHRHTQPEILHAHLPHASLFARFSRLLAPTPVLVDTIHTTATGPLSRRLAYRLTHFLTDRLTCVSRAVQESVAKARIAPSSSLLPNGIRIPNLSADLPNLTPDHHDSHMASAPGAASTPAQDSPSAQASFRWLAVGRLTRVKDYPTLLRAFSQLPPHATLAIAGSGPDLKSLQTLAAELGIAYRVHFLGFHANIEPLLAYADAFVQSSLWEGLPIAVLEASAAALPIVATDAAGTRETLIPDVTGFLVPVGDANALAATMRDLMETPSEMRRQTGQRGHAFVRASFSLSAVADQWEQLYRQLFQEALHLRKPRIPPSRNPIT